MNPADFLLDLANGTSPFLLFLNELRFNLLQLLVLCCSQSFSQLFVVYWCELLVVSDVGFMEVFAFVFVSD